MNSTAIPYRVCLGQDSVCSGINPCEMCHRARAGALVAALQASGVSNRGQVMAFVQGYANAMQHVLRETTLAQAGPAPTLNGAEWAEPDFAPALVGVSSAQLEAMSPGELRIFRSRFSDERAVQVIERVLMRKEQESEVVAQQKAAAEAQSVAAIEDKIMEPMSAAELTALIAQGQGNNVLAPKKAVITPNETLVEPQRAEEPPPSSESQPKAKLRAVHASEARESTTVEEGSGEAPAPSKETAT